MKKFLAIVLSVVLVLSMSVTAFATELNIGNQTGQSTLSFTEPSAYTVIIPDTIYVSSGVTLEFETTFLNIQQTEQLIIKVNNLDENGRIPLTNELGNTIDVWFDMNNDANIVYRVNPDSTVDYAASIGLYYVESLIPAGEYTGIAEFVVSVVPKTE